jgi:signal transduction histidine kinase
MKISLEKLYNPYLVTFLSILGSVIIFEIVNFIHPISSYGVGLTLSTVIPALIAFPISSVMIKYHKEIIENRKQLQKLNATNKKLFSLISHDIRGPIATTAQVLNLLIENDLEPEEAMSILVPLEEKNQSLLDFINDLFQWSKQQLDGDQINNTFFQAKNPISSIISLYSTDIKNKQLTINLHNTDKDIYGDKNSYSFIIRNLFQNAIKFSHPDGMINISIRETKNYLYTIVEDNGVGISTENIEKIVNRKQFYSSHGTMGEAGTGFGIYACFDYINRQNGELRIRSTIGKGTTIFVAFPKLKK